MWNNVNCSSDIEYLMHAYGGFHDSCIVSMNYVSGANVDQRKAMSLGDLSDRKLNVIFKRQWDPITIEMDFSGVRKLNLVGWQDNYLSNIFDCYIAFHNDLLGNAFDTDLIVWADTAAFNPATYYEDSILSDHNCTYVIAEQLKWRFINT